MNALPGLSRLFGEFSVLGLGHLALCEIHIQSIGRLTVLDLHLVSPSSVGFFNRTNDKDLLGKMLYTSLSNTEIRAA